VDVRTTDNCAWTATSGAAWISVFDGASGRGNGAVQLAITSNVSPTGRSGTATIAGQTFTVQQAGASAREIEVRGAVAGLSGACPDLTFTVEGRTVVTSAATEFTRRSGCRGVRNGVRVDVKGTLRADGAVIASRVRLGNDDDEDD
jgi:hypothetical protein